MNWEVKKYPAYYVVKQRFSKSAVAGNLILCSSMGGETLEANGVSANDIAKQTVVALDKIRLTLEEAGASMNDIVKTMVWLKDINDCQRMRQAELEYYQKHAPLLVDEPPASAVYQARALASPESLLQVEALATVSGGKSGWKIKKYPMYYGNVKQRFSKSVVVGNLIFCSSMGAETPDTGEVTSEDMAEQMVIALDKIRASLEESGSSMSGIIQTTINLEHLSYYPLMRETELRYYQKHAPLLVKEPPSTTFVHSPLLNHPKSLVEIEVAAVMSREKEGWEVKNYPLVYGGVKYVYPYVAPETPHGSKAVAVGDLLFLSGTTASDWETREINTFTIEGQVPLVLDKIKLTLEEAGASLDDIVKSTIYLKDIKNSQRMRQAELEYYQKHAPSLVDQPPASTIVQPFSMASPTYALEMETIAVIRRRA